MNQFIELTEYDNGRKVLINISAINLVMPYKDNTSKIDVDNSVIYFVESYDDVKEMLVMGDLDFMP